MSFSNLLLGCVSARVAGLTMIIALLSGSQVFSQKNFLLSIPEANQYAFNAAYGGMEGSLDIVAWDREQWTGIPGRPSTQSLVIHMPMYRWNGGVGLRVYNDRLGPFRYLKADLGYNYVHTGQNVLWSVGLTAGVDQVSFDGDKLRAVDGLYTGGIVIHNDPNLPEQSVSVLLPVFSAGLYIVTDRLEGGLAFENIHVSQEDISGDGINFDWIPGPGASGFVEYGYPMSGEWTVFANLFAKYDLHTVQAIAKVRAEYDELISAGIGVRGYSGQTVESFILSVGYTIDQHFSVYYAYDVGIGGLARQSSGSHEVLLRYNLQRPIGRGTIPKIIDHPRYF